MRGNPHKNNRVGGGVGGTCPFLTLDDCFDANNSDRDPYRDLDGLLFRFVDRHNNLVNIANLL